MAEAASANRIRALLLLWIEIPAAIVLSVAWVQRFPLSYVSPFLFLTFHPPSPLFLSLSLSLSLASSRIFSSYLQKFACKSRNECVSVRITNRKRFSYSPFIKSEPTRTQQGRTLDPISALSTFSHFVFLPPVCSSFVLVSLPSFFIHRCTFTCWQQQARLDYMREINRVLRETTWRSHGNSDANRDLVKPTSRNVKWVPRPVTNIPPSPSYFIFFFWRFFSPSSSSSEIFFFHASPF